MLRISSSFIALLLTLVTFFVVTPQSVAQTTFFPATGLYNGYLEQVNILECDNAGSLAVNPLLKIYSSDAKLVSSLNLAIAANGTQHVILNDLAKIRDTYGTYKLEIPSGQQLSSDRLSCRTVFYRGGAAGGSKEYDFAYALPVRNSDTGNTAGVYNSFNPTGSQDVTYNWLSVVNLDTVPFSASIQLFNSDGTLLKTLQVKNATPNSRVDLALGHDLGQVVGTYKIVPTDKTLQYQAFVMRYGISKNNFSFAFPLRSTAGSCSGSLLQLSTMGSAQTANWLEIVNLNTRAIPVTVVVRDRNGKELYRKKETLSSLSQRHLFANSIIDPEGKGNVGSAQVICDDPTDRLITESLYYGKSSADTMEWAYASQDIGSTGVTAGSQLFTPINTYLDMKNWLKIANNSRPTKAFYNVYNQKGAQQVSGEQNVGINSTADIGIHGLVGKDTVGSVITNANTSDSVFSGELLRILNNKSGDIANIIQIPGVILRSGIDSEKVSGGRTALGFMGDPQSLTEYRNALTFEEMNHLMLRAGLGTNNADILRTQGLGLSKSVDELMSFEPTPGLEAEAKTYLQYQTGDPSFISVAGTQKYWFHHMIHTPNPLKERLALIWHDLFATSCKVINDIRRSNTCYYHLNTIRDNAKGNFKTLAENLTSDFVMLYWLNGNANKVGGSDENYGREFWELFTLGEPSKHLGRYPLYTSKDVAESSRAFTGWTTPVPLVQTPGTKSLFVPARFDAGSKTVFVNTPYETKGNLNHLDVIKATLNRHEAAEWVVKRLFTAFVHDHPHAMVINELADLLLANNYNVAPVVKKILLSEAMFSMEAKQKRIKDAITYVIGFIRASGVPVSTDAVYEILKNGNLGYEPLMPGSVNGSPLNKFKGAELSSYFLGWNSTYINAVRDVLSKAPTASPGFSYRSLLPFAGATPDQIIKHWSLVLGIKLAPEELSKLTTYMSTFKKMVNGKAVNVTVAFDPTNETHLREKIPGLLWLLSQHEDYLTF